MDGYITFWSKEYVKELEKHNDNGKICVVYGSQHQRMPSVSALKTGDIIYPVAIRDRTLCVMARMPVEKIEPAFYYLIRETGEYHSALIPEGILIRSQGVFGEFNMFSGGSGYSGKVRIPDNIHTVIDENSLVPKPHRFHQEPITCCAKLAVSSENGSLIFPRPIPLETVAVLKFGKTKSTQKSLRFDKNGNLTSISLSGFVRKMSDETFEIFEKLF